MKLVCMTREEEFGIHGTKGHRMIQQNLELSVGSLGENKVGKIQNPETWPRRLEMETKTL